MATYYEIRQRVDTIYKGWLETIYKSESERVAKIAFDEIRRDHPDAYVELIKVTHNEECLDFTSTV
jgi:hypothetical protein